MSKLFEIKGYKDNSYFLTTNGNSLGEGGKSGVVGYDSSKDAWRIVRYPLDLSNIKDTTP
jgi:hypothetical protein